MGYDQYLDEIIYIPYDFSNHECPRQTISITYRDRDGTKLGEPTEHIITDATSFSKRVYYWRNMYGIDQFLADVMGDSDNRHHVFDGETLLQLRDYLQEYLDMNRITEEDPKYEEYIRETYRKTIAFINSLGKIEERTFEYTAW